MGHYLGQQHNWVLVSCVGFNPVSAVVCARHYGVHRTVLLGTPETQSLMDTVSRQVGVSTTTLACDEAERTIPAIGRKLHEKLALADNEQVVFDLTGGMKLLALGAWAVISSLASERAEVVYLQADGRLMDAMTGVCHQAEVTVTVAEALELHGATVRASSWTGAPGEIPDDVRERAELGRFLYAALSQKALHTNSSDNIARLTPAICWPDSLPAGISRRGMRLKADIPGYFQKNSWLEEFCLTQVWHALPHDDMTRIAAGLEVAIGKAADEADVVIVRGTRICIIEAKARRDSKKAGADLQKRISKTRHFFGSHAAVVFVHPAWTWTAMNALDAGTDRNVFLVGGDNSDQLRAIIRQVLVD